jgi:hypothetical protein
LEVKLSPVNQLAALILKLLKIYLWIIAIAAVIGGVAGITAAIMSP